MKLYYELIKNSLQTGMAYKFDTYLQLLNRLIGMFVQISIWLALYKGAGETSSNNGNISIGAMVTYVIVSTGITIIAGNDVIWRLDRKIKTGEIAMDLLKPISLKFSLLCTTVGQRVYLFLFQLLPTTIIAALFFGIQLPSWQNAILFIISLINGMIIYFIITYIIGLIGFWYLSIWHFSRMLEDLIRLFSGSVIPLWFFPGFLAKISAFLPFRLIYYTPITIFLQKVNAVEVCSILGQQILWILALLMLERVVWAKGITRLVIQGG